MFARTTNPESLRQSFEALSSLLVDTTLRISPMGLDIRQLDSTGSTFVALSFPIHKWDEFSCLKHGHYGVNVLSFAKVLKTTKGSKELRLVIDDPAKMKIVATGGGTTVYHTVNLLDFKLSDVTPPDIDYPLEIDLHTKTFKRLVGDLGSLADQVTIHQQENGLEFVASGPFTEQRVLLPQGEFLAFMNDELTSPAGPYSLRVISLFAKAANNDLVRLKAKPGLPLVFEYTTPLGGILFATSPVA